MNHMTNEELIAVLQKLPPKEFVSVHINVNNDGFNRMRIVQGAESIGGLTYLRFRDDMDVPEGLTIHVES